MKDYKSTVLSKKHFTKEQLAEFRKVSIADYMNWYEPGSVIHKEGSYRLRSNESMVLNGTWARDFAASECTTMGKKNPACGIDAVMQLCGLNFFQAACAVNDFMSALLPSSYPPIESQLSLEEFHKQIDQGKYINADGNSNIFAYLTQTRGIPAELVMEYIDEDFLYLETLPTGYNLLFAMYASNGMKALHGFERCGILSHSAKKYKGSIVSVPKCYFQNWISTYEKPEDLCNSRALVFESAIDAISFHALVRMGKIILPKNETFTLLSLRGVHYSILAYFLAEEFANAYEYSEPGAVYRDIDEVVFCVDTDSAGDGLCKTATEKLDGHYQISSLRNVLLCYGVKDWNELLAKNDEIVTPIDLNKVTADYTLEKSSKYE